MKIKSLLYLSLIAALLSGSVFLWAAACEPEIGEWAQFKKPPSSYELTGIRQLHFSTAKVFSGPRGIINTQADPNRMAGDYTVQTFWADDHLEFKFFRNNQLAGVLFLERPKAWIFFQAEAKRLHTQEGAPRMYKEIRIEGELQASGALALKSVLNPHFRLIFQGEGGRCFEANHFSRWVLQVSGRNLQNPTSRRRTSYYSVRGPLGS